MAKKMRSIETGVIFDYNEAWKSLPHIYEIFEDEAAPKPKRRRRKKVAEPTNELDAK